MADPLITIDGIPASPDGQRLNGGDDGEAIALSSTGAPIAGLIVSAEGGDDHVTLEGTTVDTNVFGGDGDDTLVVSTGGGGISLSRLFAGGGNDRVELLQVSAADVTVGTSDGNDILQLSGSFQRTDLFSNDGDDRISFAGPSSFLRGRLFSGDGNDLLSDGGFAVDLSGSELGFRDGDDQVDLAASFAGSGADGLAVFLGDGNDRFTGPTRGDLLLMAGAGDDTITGGGGSDTLSGLEGADLFIQNLGASASVAAVQAAAELTITFAARPDLITDFQTAATAAAITPGATTAAAITPAIPGDRIAFAGWDGPPGNINDNRGSATGTFGSGNVVLYSGSFDAAAGTFTTTGNNAGPDVLAFRSTGSSTSDGFLSEHFGDQAVVLLGASGQAFDGGSGGDFLAF